MHVRPLSVAIGVALCVFAWGGRAEARGHGRGVHRARTHKRQQTRRTQRQRKAARPTPPPQEKAPEAPPPEAPQAEAPPVQHHGPTRLDFDDRLIQGQTNKAGAVYLYERKELKVRSMVRLRDNFRPEIYDSVTGGD
jgi:hypothetical protein